MFIYRRVRDLREDHDKTQKDIAEFCKKVKALGFLVKLDTNGSFPHRLRQLMEEKLVDYVAMDIKNSREFYAETCGLEVMPDGVEESIHLLMNSTIPHEFRTTVVKEHHSFERLEALAREMAGAEHFYLQKFTDSGDLIGASLSAYSDEEMREILALVRGYIPSAELRGV